jgi:dTDP-4-dehydrorhamnose 3,5-epimerase
VIFRRTPISGAFLVETEPYEDERGRFARVFCAGEFAEHGLETSYVQANSGFSVARATLRGLHYQLPPYAETKLVRCTRGAVFDVIADLRTGSPSHFQWFGVELEPDSGLSVYVPQGCAHGYVTLADATEVSYLTSASYAPELERGVHFADPTLAIEWPLTPAVVSDRDSSWPFLASDRQAS